MKEPVEDFLNADREKQLIQAIREAEKNTSGEIRVHLDAHSDLPHLVRAKAVFAELNMHQTQARNAVLFYVAIADRAFAIFGDKGIDEAVPDDFWESIRDAMRELFKQGAFTEALVSGIRETGKALKQYFPHRDDDVNELPDDISSG